MTVYGRLFLLSLLSFSYSKANGFLPRQIDHHQQLSMRVATVILPELLLSIYQTGYWFAWCHFVLAYPPFLACVSRSLIYCDHRKIPMENKMILSNSIAVSRKRMKNSSVIHLLMHQNEMTHLIFLFCLISRGSIFFAETKMYKLH